jgi:hypothetical protein
LLPGKQVYFLLLLAVVKNRLYQLAQVNCLRQNVCLYFDLGTDEANVVG